MIANHLIPRYLQISRALIEEIFSSGLRPQEKLPSLRELAQHFNATVVTIRKAVDVLQDEGWVVCHHGKGIFVADNPPTIPFTVTLLLNCQGHLFSSLFSALSINLQAEGHQILTVDIPEDAQIAERFQNLIANRPEALIVDGTAHFPFELLPKEIRTTFVFRCESPKPPEWANRVLADFREAGKMAARHLMGQGMREAVYFGFWSQLRPCGDGLGPEYYYQRHLYTGFREELVGAGCKVTTILDGAPCPQSSLKDVLRPGLGLFCSGDYMAVQIYQICAGLGLAIGTDIKVLGLFDTPWCSALTPELSSISVNEQEIAREAVRLTGARSQGELILVPPLLKARASTGCAGVPCPIFRKP